MYQQHQQASASKLAAGQQESKVESLESIHAARLRSGSEAGTSAPQVGRPPAATPKSQSALDSEAEDETAFGNGGMGEPDTETDPYLLPVSHEVALEGVCFSRRHCLHWCLFSLHLSGTSDCYTTPTSHV